MPRSLSRGGLKLLRGGKGLSFRTGQYIGESLLVGLVTGIVVVGFKYLTNLGADWISLKLGHLAARAALPTWSDIASGFSAAALSDPHRWIMLLLPALGALAGRVLIRRFDRLEHARGTDSAIRAYHLHDGYVTTTVIPVKSVASVLTVASGGSAGYEGPVTLIGAACGAMVARVLKLTLRARRILMAAGLAAGIGALFQAPLAGALFGFEIFYSSSDVEYETLLPSCIASAVAYTVFAYFYGWGSLFEMPADLTYDSGFRLLPYFVLALVIAFGARFYISFFRWTEARFGAARIRGSAKVVIGGLLTGLIGFFFPDILGTGYALIQQTFSASGHESFVGCGLLLVVLFFLKAIATSFTVGSGGSGGVFAPAIVCGGALGCAVGLFFARVLPDWVGIHPAAFALVGMAGFLASAVRVPLTAVVIVAEISGNHELLLPAMWTCGIAFWLNNGWSLYRSQPHCRTSSALH